MHLLEINGLNAGYGHLQVLWDVSLQVAEGEFVALIGPNGAGKTTILNAIAGLHQPMGGEIKFLGKPMAGLPAYEVCSLGIVLVPEKLNLFAGMSVSDNLTLGAYTIRADKQKAAKMLRFVYDLFPVLGQRQHQAAGTLSGGERKMLALGRGLMSDPKALLVDEPSLGLAPLTTKAVFQVLQELNRRGITILLVEQNVKATLQMTRRSYVLEQGHVVQEGASLELLTGEHIRKAYLGL